MKRMYALIIAVLVTASAFPETIKQTELIISAAVSLTAAMNELIVLYKAEKPDIKVTPTYGASGALQMQIEQGAPADIFFSAAPKQMNALIEKGLILEGTKKDMLENTIVLVTLKTKKDVSSFTDAGTDKIKQIALGEPKSVPAGQYTEQVFTSLKILEAVKAKVVYAKDVRQILTYVETGEVDAGVVYATDAAVEKNVTIAAVAPKGSHSPVIYPAAVVKATVSPDAAKAFLLWLSGPQADAVFLHYGFMVLP